MGVSNAPNYELINRAVRHEPVYSAEPIDLVLNRFTPRFLEKLAEFAYKLTKITVIGLSEPILPVKSWKNSENNNYFLKNKLNIGPFLEKSAGRTG